LDDRVTRRVVVIGAGIVGAALAAELAGRDGLAVTVLERGRMTGCWDPRGTRPG